METAIDILYSLDPIPQRTEEEIELLQKRKNYWNSHLEVCCFENNNTVLSFIIIDICDRTFCVQTMATFKSDGSFQDTISQGSVEVIPANLTAEEFIRTRFIFSENDFIIIDDEHRKDIVNYLLNQIN